jgi:hypothetical protein
MNHFGIGARPIASKQTEEQKAVAASINNDNV